MSGHPQLSPYLNRFTTLWQDKADVKLEFTCKDGNVIVNLSHNLGSIVKVTEEVKTQSPNSGNILKKNVSLSQIVRLKKRAAEKATAEKLEAEQVKANLLKSLMNLHRASRLKLRFHQLPKLRMMLRRQKTML